MVRSLRSLKDEGYLSIFKMVIEQGPALFNIEYLMHNLKSFAQNSLKREAKFPPAQKQNMERLERTFIGALFTHFNGKEDAERFLRS